MNYRYKVGGQEIVLPVAEDLVAVRFTEPAPHSARARAASQPELASFEDRFEVPGEKVTVLKVAAAPQARGARLESAMVSLDSIEDVDRVSPVFKVGDAYAIAVNRLMVGFTNETGAKKILKDHDCEVIEQMGSEFLVSIDPTADPFEVAAKLDALAKVEYAEPDFTNFGTHVARSVMPELDPLVPDQYAVAITKADQAWQVQVGDPEIRIAILDEGVDSHHEDLAAALVGSYDGVDDDTFQEPNGWDAHGTCCAGLAAAIHNEKGVRGIASGCSLIAVRIAYSSSPGNNWTTSNSWIRRAIDWSWQNGADVLSNSWGGGAPSSAITNAFSRARTQGRDGKGAVVVIAAGNANSLHDYPGNLDNVLTVSASNEFDEPKTPTSQDGEHWWGSNFGPKIDVAAPGVHNYTTDNSGSNGYNNTPGEEGNYVSNFNGTSSACPIVAGVAGLVLSANPNLTEAEVRDIIRQTADKVGPLPYQNGRNDRMGHGRVNALAAVRAAAGDEDIPPPSGKHTPVSNLDHIDDSEVGRSMAFAPTRGSAKSKKPATKDGLEKLASDGPDARARRMQAPVTETLPDIAVASYGEPLPQPETVHGEDDRRRIENTDDYPWRVHASLLITARDGSRWIGTGWFVGPRTLITAGHVVYIKNSGIPERDGWVSRIEVMPGRNANELPYGAVTSEVFHSVARMVRGRRSQVRLWSHSHSHPTGRPGGHDRIQRFR